LSPLTIVVGRNAAGKSNFVDALCFVRDALRVSLDFALRDRGGVGEVRRRSGGHPTHLGIRIDWQLPGCHGRYAFEIGAQPSGGFVVKRERCEVHDQSGRHLFDVTNGVVSTTMSQMPPAYTDRLYLVNAAGLAPFRSLYDALSNMGFYNLNPKVIRDLQDPDDGMLLSKFGENLASVVARLERVHPDRRARIEAYLRQVAPNVHGFEFKELGPKHTLQFRQEVEGQRDPWRFWAANMSDGTLRALAVLVAVFQHPLDARIPLVAIEEPETALHPAAARILLEALREASTERQILVTSHSSEMLDTHEIDPTELLIVVGTNGRSTIGTIDDASVTALKNHLCTAGELLRLDQIAPSAVPPLFAAVDAQRDLFGQW
jgi:predicted ATPase